MARTVEEIQKANILKIQELLPNLTSPSVTATFRLFSYVIAVSIAVLEQVIDNAKAQIQTIANNTPVGTASWWVDKAKSFQYDALNPQIVLERPDHSVGYPVVNEELRIITAASLVVNESKRITLKVAKGDISALQPLATAEFNAVRSYVDRIALAGLVPDVVSASSDKLFLDVDIYYDGQYVQGEVLTNCTDAVNTYLQTLDFSGKVFIQGVTDAIQSVVGVSDVVINDMVLRSDTQTIATGTELVNSKTTIVRSSTSFAGYVNGETTVGFTFADTFNLIIK